MLNRTKFVKLLSAVCELYGKELSLMAIDIYYETLKEYSYEQINKAFNSVARTNKYNCIPKPAEIIENIEDRKNISYKPFKKELEILPDYSPEGQKRVHDLIKGITEKTVAYEYKNDLEYSMKRASEFASKFQDQIGIVE